MKEFVLFKTPEDPGTSMNSLTLKSAEGEVRFCFYEVEPGVSHHSIRLELGRHSKMEAVIFQDVPIDQSVRIRICADLSEGALLQVILVQNGGLNAQVDFDAAYQGKGARVELRGLQNSKGRQKLAIQANSNHSIPHTSSDLQVWCAARDESRSVFNGGVRIEKGAHHTEAFQKNRNLILSKQAVVDSFPKLFIANDNVKCAHGSSTSTLEPEQAYYLQARGIDASQAEQMLISGFIRQAISTISDLNCRYTLEDRLGVRDEEG
ncbi:SufD family Fe-S cluster assembly protein, partial [bacterium]|nr:SufD family Fe-S cluster assembly protein [bacterium]